VIEGRRAAAFVYATLAADTGAGGVSTLLGGRIYPQRVPQNATLPACLIQLASATPTNTTGGRRVFKTALVDVHLIAEGMSMDSLDDIADRIDAVLQNAAGTKDGATIVELVQDSEQEYTEDDAGKVFMHSVQTYRCAVHA
jgi:hypothetical protein